MSKANYGIEVVAVTFASWIIAQGIKVISSAIAQKKFDFRWFLGAGGMPSAHAAGVTALATSVALTEGIDSILFGITMIFTLIVMFDAQGVRRAAGKQAKILNKIVDDIYLKRGIEQDRLRELVGHTPVEVIAGAILGIMISLVGFYRFVWR